LEKYKSLILNIIVLKKILGYYFTQQWERCNRQTNEEWINDIGDDEAKVRNVGEGVL
jgi:hypothetical protein